MRVMFDVVVRTPNTPFVAVDLMFQDVIEAISIFGMPHGVPLAATGERV